MTCIKLKPHQQEALGKLKPGAILVGGVGSGKTYTSLFYYKQNFSNLKLYIITTAIKRDKNDWVIEANNIGITDIVVDSWNNIQKYKDLKHSFFIFDEQKVSGYGKWSKSFIKIAKANKWILLSATPGDQWIDFIPVFLANNFYRNITEFRREHIEYDPFVQFPKIRKIHNVEKLECLRNNICVTMSDERHTKRHVISVPYEYDKTLYSQVFNDRWNYIENRPIESATEWCLLQRRVLDNEFRKWYTKWIISLHQNIIVFYNFNYELESLINICKDLNRAYYQRNGFKHDMLPDSDYVYLVQYRSGSEAWNCTTTNVILYYSLNHSHKILEQTRGRIDRMNTPFKDLYYYELSTDSPIDKKMAKCIKNKKLFNAGLFAYEAGIEFSKEIN